MALFTRGKCLLKPLLDRVGISQAELARRTGISERMISYYVKDQKPMSVDAMYTISRVLNCRMEDLYQWVKSR
ncbi:helix-turn-helix domain-containing protein [Brevibacillus sp. B_LB10_24]|uniref:helix-turn-helix domain-containing protein n=1 Tax=Brevibacillus sp. B_LB10_24 TaxID=3380645 RepID=UPI0038B71F29